jgi:hypothetical protein
MGIALVKVLHLIHELLVLNAESFQNGLQFGRNMASYIHKCEVVLLRDRQCIVNGIAVYLMPRL